MLWKYAAKLAPAKRYERPASWNGVFHRRIADWVAASERLGRPTIPIAFLCWAQLGGVIYVVPTGTASDRSDLDLDVEFVRHVKRAELFAATWWARSEGPHVRALDAVPELSRVLELELRFSAPEVSTQRIYRASDEWDEARIQWQLATLREMRRAAGSPEFGAGKAFAFITLGLPGSGKSSVLRRIAAEFVRAEGGPSQQRVCDPDELRVRFPEYEGGLGSGIVQDELRRMSYDDPLDPLSFGCQSLLDTVSSTALGAVTVVFDTIGDPEYTPALIRRLRASGWYIYVLLADCPLDEAVRRTKRRALETGRFVLPDYIRSADGRPMRAFEVCEREALSGFAVIDTSASDGKPPVIRRGDSRNTFGAPGQRAVFW